MNIEIKIIVKIVVGLILFEVNNHINIAPAVELVCQHRPEYKQI